MKKLIEIILILILITFFSFPAYVSAHTTYSKGPVGSKHNNWYIRSPYVEFTVHESDPCYGNTVGVNEHPPGLWWPYLEKEGSHDYKIYTNVEYTKYWYKFDNQTPYPTWNCGSGGSYSTVIWQGHVNLDTGNPMVSIGSPAENANFSSEKIVVSGKAADSTSGINSVKVNGKNANIQSNHFSVEITLNTGLNTIKAVATDVSGRTAQDKVVVFRKEIPDEDDEQTNGSDDPNNQSNNTASKEVTESASKLKNGDSQTNEDEGAIDTIVGGIVDHKTESITIGFLLALIVVMLLERFGFIKLKLPDSVKELVKRVSKEQK